MLPVSESDAVADAGAVGSAAEADEDPDDPDDAAGEDDVEEGEELLLQAAMVIAAIEAMAGKASAFIRTPRRLAVRFGAGSLLATVGYSFYWLLSLFARAIRAG